jgi:transcriptional regulator with XRE-family HTH domain
MTLAEVAARAGMAVSTVSRLETGARRIALDHLPPLAAALGVSADDLLGDGGTRDPRVRRTAPHHHDGITSWPLSGSAPAGLRAFKLRIDPSRTVPDTRTHEGHEWLYVLSGRLRLVLGERDLTVDAGEALEFSTLLPHWVGAVDGPAEAIAIFGPQGERVHLRDPV